MNDSDVFDIFDDKNDDKNIENDEEFLEELTEEEPELPSPIIDVSISKDKLYAYLTIDQDPPVPYQVTVDAIYDILAKSKVEYGVMMDKIDLVVTNQEYPDNELIAVGQEMMPGIDGQLEYTFSVVMGGRPKDMGHYVDHYDLNLVENVVADQVLVRKIPARQGEPGMSVYGQPLRAPRAKDVRLPVGKGTKISDNDPNELVAKTDGFVRIDTRSFNRIVVEEIFTVNGNVDLSTGNLDIEGSVSIRGNVREGFEVKATGNIQVAGVMEAGALDAGGGIDVRGGIVGGKHGAVLKAENDIVVKFADNARMTTRDNIIVADEVFNCDLMADKNVTVGGSGKSAGAIIGGVVSAGKEIRAASVGTDAGILTRLRVGAQPGLVDRRRNMQADVKHLKDKLKEQQSVIQALIRRKEDREPAQQDRARQKTTLEQKQTESGHRMKGLISQAEQEGLVTPTHVIETLEGEINSTRETLKRVESSVDTLKARIETKASLADMMKNRKTLEQFQAARENMVSKLTELETQLAQRTANPWANLPWGTRRELEQLQGHIKNIAGQIGSIEAENTIDEKIDDALSQLNLKQTDLKRELSNLQMELEAVKREIEKNSQQIARIIVSDKLWSGTEVTLKNRRRRFTKSRTGVKVQLSENDAIIATNLV